MNQFYSIENHGSANFDVFKGEALMKGKCTYKATMLVFDKVIYGIKLVSI